MPVSLRLIQQDDLPQVMGWRMLPEITQYMYTDPILDDRAQQRWFEHVSSSNNDLVWIIELDDGRAVGLLSVSGIDRKNSRCSWAYYIAEESGRGKGLAKPLECNIADFVFDRLGLHKLCCEVFSINDRVVDLHKRFGSKVEGVLREHIRKGDQVFDVVQMGLLRLDWLSLRETLKYSTIAIDCPSDCRRIWNSQ